MKPPKVNIVEVYQHYDLRIFAADRGGWRAAQCPLPDHDDRHPSASIHEDGCRWKCHACDQGGDAADVVMAQEQCDLKTAIGILNQFTEGTPTPAGSQGLRPRARAGRRNWSPPWKTM